MSKRVLGLDIGSNSIGFSLLDLEEKNGQIVFEELTSNSIIFSKSNTAEDRRKGRSSRRLNKRKKSRNKNARKIFVKYKIADETFIDDTTNYLNTLNLETKDVYQLRENAVLGKALSKEEFVFAVYSILTNRGYNNMFSTSKEDGVINESVNKNTKEYLEKNYPLPSMVLTNYRKENEDTYQNLPIRNKKNDYRNSLGREMHIEEFKKVVLSQENNKELFKTPQECYDFISHIVEDKFNTFYQRPLKSFENMVEFCSFYDKFNPKGSYKRCPLANIKNIELTLRKTIDNHKEYILDKNGEIKNLTNEELSIIVDFWINTPNVDKITNKNVFKNAGFKDIKIHVKDNKDLIILDIKAYRNILSVLNKYNIDFIHTQNSFYNEMLLELYYFKNTSSRIEHIEEIIKKYSLPLDENFVKELAALENIDGFASFSLEFTNEVLELINKENKTYHEAIESLGYFGKYVNMPTYDYLPPLEPTEADIKWLQANLPYFETKHLFFQPMVSSQVKRVIGVLRKLINETIKRYGKIDEIRIETAKEMNSKKEKENILKNQNKDKKKNDEAKKFLKANNIKESSKNIERAKLFIEQGKDACLCFYSGKVITQDEAFDENETEVEHFIPRSVIWINSYKNKILVKKVSNQNKSNQNPISFLKLTNSWDDFKGRVENSFMSQEKKKWLSNETIINNVMKKEHWQDSFLNDTRAATKIITKYLNHYLYPKQNKYGKGESRHVYSVSGKAINELKYIWGISNVMPKNEDNKKDRNTNYHHTLDAFTVALCSSMAINTLHNYFKKQENKFKTKALKEKLTLNIPVSKDGVNIIEYLKTLVQKYENNEFYVCPYNKRKTNMKGFKDGNLKLYITKDSKGNEILAEMEKIAIDKSLLIKIVNGFEKNRSDSEVKKEIISIQKRLNPQKQKDIIEAIEIYANKLLHLRAELEQILKDIKPLDEKKKVSKSKKEENIELDDQIRALKVKKEVLLKEMLDLKCSFSTKNGKKNVVRSLDLYKAKISKIESGVIIYPNRKENKIEIISVENYKKAIESREPFLVKMNEKGSTLSVDIYTDKKQGQLVGLNYFSSKANKDILSRAKRPLTVDNKLKIKLHKNDLVKIIDKEENKTNFYIVEGGGDVSGSNNKIKLKGINKTLDNTLCQTLNNDFIIKKVNVDFFGNIIED